VEFSSDPNCLSEYCKCLLFELEDVTRITYSLVRLGSCARKQALSAGRFLWKVIVWDKVLGLRSTDALLGDVAT
jgi:hypothetical protein